MKIFLREFLESDREALRELFVAARSAAFSWVSPDDHKLEDFDRFTEGERILVAVEANRPIGFASIWEPDSFLHNLFIHPEFQGQGVGQILLAYCDQYFMDTPTLKCLKSNQRAQQFYQSQGWTVLSEEEDPCGSYFLMKRF